MKTLLLLTIFLAGCVSAIVIKGLTFPPFPVLHFVSGSANSVCLPAQDAVEFDKWIDKLRAFKAAYERVGKDIP